LPPSAPGRTIRGVYERFDDADVARDYLELLRRGSVVRRLAPAQHPAWRRAIRASARTDELRIRTWSRGGRPATVWAVLPDWSLTLEERELLLRRLAWQRES
jgi:hypothetical protein